MYPGQKEARFITLFREDAALEDLTDWLTRLDYRSREDTEAGRRAQRIKAVVKDVVDHLLPVASHFPGLALTAPSSILPIAPIP